MTIGTEIDAVLSNMDARLTILENENFAVTVSSMETTLNGLAPQIKALSTTDLSTLQSISKNFFGLIFPPVTADRPPVWTQVPTITFTQGKASVFSVAAFASDPDGDLLTFTKNSVSLPAGVTFDAVNKQFIYDGVGQVSITTGHAITADDGVA